ncbi:MAG TPA: hypothetical protein VNN80_27320, partial [Polyangiaceae bacterium]|nr:hypothetical protein [Polyangiaceae bacterium]
MTLPSTPASEREIERQKHSNSNAAHQFDAYASHRARLTELLLARGEAVASAGAAPRLCVLGAGNCGDLDLERLASRYRSIHLVDIDADALAQARDLVDERDARGQERVGDVLDHLGRSDV